MNNNYLKNAYYLMIKKGFYDSQLDEALLNLLLIVIKNRHYEILPDTKTLIKDFKSIIGFELPYFPMQTIIGLAKKNDYLIEGNGKGEFNPDFSKINKITSMKEIIDRERLINELQNAFCDFLKENDSENEYSLEKVAELIDSFVEFQGALFYYDKDKYFSSHEDYLFAKFISGNSQYYNLIDELITGRILSELLIHDEGNIDIKNTSFANTTVYLDAAILFILLDIDELHRFETYKKLICDMKELGITVKVFKHTFAEVENIIANSIQWINNPDFEPARSSKAAYYFVTNNYSVDVIEEKLSLMRKEIEDVNGIEIEDMDYPYAPEGCKYFEQDYYDAIRDFYADRNFAFSEEEKRETIENDAKSFFYISIKNNFIPSFSIGDLKTVLLTSNTSLAIVSKKFAENERSIPFCVTDIFFGALIWKSNPKLVDLPSKQKLSSFLYQAYLPTDAMFEKFSSVIAKSLEEQTITEEDCIVLKQNKSAAKLLVEITEGDIDRITINTPHDIMQSIRAKAKEEGRLEELERSSAIIKGKDEIISKTKQEHWQERVERNASDIRNTKALIKAKEIAIERIESERSNGQKIAKKAPKKNGVIIAIVMVVIIALAFIIFELGKKANQDYFGIIGLVISVIGAFGPYVFCAFSNGKEFNPKKLFKALYDKALNEYYVQHNCSDDIMLEENSELYRLNKLLNELEKKEQVDYFGE